MCCPDLRTKPHARKDVRVKLDLCASGRVQCVRKRNACAIASCKEHAHACAKCVCNCVHICVRKRVRKCACASACTNVCANACAHEFPDACGHECTREHAKCADTCAILLFFMRFVCVTTWCCHQPCPIQAIGLQIVSCGFCKHRFGTITYQKRSCTRVCVWCHDSACASACACCQRWCVCVLARVLVCEAFGWSCNPGGSKLVTIIFSTFEMAAGHFCTTGNPARPRESALPCTLRH